MVTNPKMYGIDCDICHKHFATQDKIIAYTRLQDTEEMAEAMGWELWKGGHTCPICLAKLKDESK